MSLVGLVAKNNYIHFKYGLVVRYLQPALGEGSTFRDPIPKSRKAVLDT